MVLPEQLDIPDPVLDIHRRLEDAGFETWCVGGAIRDGLLDNRQADVDLATAALPADVQRIFRRTVPVGVEHGTVGVLDDAGTLHEVTTFRRDVRTDGRHAVVEFGVSLDDDLARRDFTINAIAWHPIRKAWRDPFDGMADLQRGVIRAVGNPVDRFREDRLRILRALRFAARFDFAIDPTTWDAACAQAADTAQLSAERVREEWWKGTASARDHHAMLQLWQASGVADAWFAEGQAQQLPVGQLPAVVTADPVLLLAAWRRPVEPILRRLKASGADIGRARGIDRGPAHPSDARPVQVRRWLATVGRSAPDLLALATLDPDAGPWTTEAVAVIGRGEATTRADLAVSGDDLVRAGIVAPGPALGRLLEVLLELVLEDPARNHPETLLARARTVSRDDGTSSPSA